jgi:sRNA-binding carbon storage regulator CsrA
MHADSLARGRGVERTHFRKGIRMLVLTRNVDQSFVIHVPPSTESREILVTVCDVRSGTTERSKARTRIGVDAPRDCIVLRSELQKKDAVCSRMLV